MRLRLRRLVRGQRCRVCGTRRRIKWFYDTSCCSYDCIFRGLASIQDQIRKA